MMLNIDSFAKQVRKELTRRHLTHYRVAMDLSENPVVLAQLLSGFRKHNRLREKLSRYLGIPLNNK